MIILLLSTMNLSAIKPDRVYPYTPDKLGLTYEELKVRTKDGLSLNVWHLPSETGGIPVIISQSDAGNMGSWLYLGLYLQAYGLDVWMYDYRGFGQSDDFRIVSDQLFHTEFVTDLDSVAEHVYARTGKSPVMMGISMGTVIVNEFLRETDIPVNKVIFDGYVAEPDEWIRKLAENGKTVVLPEGYRNRQYRPRHTDCLYIVSAKDDYSTIHDLPKAGRNRQVIKEFDCEHISGFFRYPDEYTEAVTAFIEQ